MSVAVVQSKGGSVNAGTTLNLALTSNVTAGNLLIVGVSCHSSVTVTVSDSQSNSYTQDLSASYSGGGPSVHIYRTLIGSTGTCTVTLSSAGSSFLVTANVDEVSGLGASPFDVSSNINFRSNATAQPAVTSVTPSTATDYGMTIATTNSATVVWTTPSGWTSRENDSNGTNIVSTVLSSSSAINPTFTEGAFGSVNWTCGIVLYKPTAAPYDPSSGTFAVQDQPRPIPRRMPIRQEPFVDAGPAFFLNDPFTFNPASKMPWAGYDLPRPLPRRKPIQQVEFVPSPQPIDLAAILAVWAVPPEVPQKRARPVLMGEGGDVILSYVTQSQGWDQAYERPQPRIKRILDVDIVQPLTVPKDDLGGLTGWSQDYYVPPIPRPKPVKYDTITFVDIKAGYDPQSERVPLQDPGQPVARRQKPLRDVPADDAATMFAANAIATDTLPASWAEETPVRPLPRPRPLQGEYAFVLTSSQVAAPIVPLMDVDVRPWLRQKPLNVGGSFDPAWIVSTPIIVAGPYYAVAQTFWVSGAVAGMVSTE